MSSLTDEDKQQYQKLMAEYDELIAKIAAYRQNSEKPDSIPSNNLDAAPATSPTPSAKSSDASNLPMSDEERLAELRKKLNI
jgi:hypothetical protein